MQTLQKAYDDLARTAQNTYNASLGRMGVGRIYLMPGAHDVGSGLQLQQTRSVEIVGALAGMFRGNEVTASNPSAAVVFSSSSSAAELVRIRNNPATQMNGYGFVFQNIVFDLDAASLTAAIRAYCCSLVTVEQNVFNASSPKKAFAVWADIAPTLGDDNSWWYVCHNQMRNVGIVQVPGTTQQQNRWQIVGNVAWTDAGGVPTLLDLHYLDMALIESNNLEGPVVGARLSNCYNCTLINNAGESTPDSTLPFYQFVNSANNVVIGGDCRFAGPDSATAVFANFDADSMFNMVINPSIVSAGTSSARKDKVTDDSTSRTNLVMSERGFAPYGNGVKMPNVAADPPAGDGSIWYLSNKTGAWMKALVGGAPHKLALLDRSDTYTARPSFSQGFTGKYKAGAGVTISDADFSKPPPDGTEATTYDTLARVTKKWVRANGAWRSVTLN